MSKGMEILMIQRPSARLTRALEEQGYGVKTAGSITEADRMARAACYDLVILDLAYAGTDGLAVVKKWRDDGMDGHVLILAAQRSARLKAFDAGADVLVMEPYTVGELLAQIRALFRRPRLPRAPVLEIHDLRIDLSARSVTRAGRPIHLTRAEFDVLHFLACNCGNAVTRAAIWEHLYGEGEEMTSNVVDVCINHLRTKVDRGFDKPLILTCRGTGYMLRADT
jgi:DNA-binding response OmpR family regulator